MQGSLLGECVKERDKGFRMEEITDVRGRTTGEKLAEREGENNSQKLRTIGKEKTVSYAL